MALMAASAKVDITPRTPSFLAGYAGRDHAHEDVHDPLSLRALYVRGEGGDALLVSADIIGFPEALVERILPALEAQLDLPRERVMLCGTHTHSAPVGRGERANREWVSMLEKQVTAAAAIARSRLAEVVLKVGRGSCNIGINRRESKSASEVILGAQPIVLGQNPDGPIDRELIALAVDGLDGRPVARVCNFACHGVVLGQHNYAISGDWPGLAAVRIEEETDGAPFLFLNGGAANVNPRIAVQTEFGPVEQTADEFCASFRAACKELAAAPDDNRVNGAAPILQLPRKQRDVEDGLGATGPVRVQGLRLGALCVVGSSCEIFSETTMAVKETSTKGLTMVASYTGSGGGGYVPVAEAYREGGYEIRVTPYAQGAEAIFRDGLLTLLQAL